MKKHVSIILLFLLLGALILPMQARADVIYEPWDSFYEAHRDECVYVCRAYTAQGPNGDVTVYESPESAQVEGTVTNGVSLYISYTYETGDGVVWGCYEDWNSDLSGWVPMDYLELIYDGISFTEEYGDQFIDVNGILDEEYQGKTIYLWEYPGCESGNAFTLQDDAEYLPQYSEEFTDANGTRWGRCSYYMGFKGYWINLDDPTASEPVKLPDRAEETAAQTDAPETEAVKEIVPKEPDSVKTVKIIAILAVAAVAAVTAVLLVLLRKKK